MLKCTKHTIVQTWLIPVSCIRCDRIFLRISIKLTSRVVQAFIATRHEDHIIVNLAWYLLQFVIYSKIYCLAVITNVIMITKRQLFCSTVHR